MKTVISKSTGGLGGASSRGSGKSHFLQCGPALATFYFRLNLFTVFFFFFRKLLQPIRSCLLTSCCGCTRVSDRSKFPSHLPPRLASWTPSTWGRVHRRRLGSSATCLQARTDPGDGPRRGASGGLLIDGILARRQLACAVPSELIQTANGSAGVSAPQPIRGRLQRLAAARGLWGGFIHTLKYGKRLRRYDSDANAEC